MYNTKLGCGVLGDFDLSISRRHPRVPGTDRTGTIPFMAIDLLCDKYWNGEIEREYRHELEACIWILPFVFLRYQDGKSQRGTPVDAWLRSDYIACAEKKAHFMMVNILADNEKLCQLDFKDHWRLAEELLYWLRSWLNTIQYNARSRDETSTEHESSLVSVWPLFVAQLRSIAKKFPLLLGYINTVIDDLGLEEPFWVRHDIPKS